MRIGRLRHRLALQAVTRSNDEYGQPTETFATYTTVWGRLEPISAKEQISAQAQTAEVTHFAEIRYNASVAPTDRISFDSRTFEITSMMNMREVNHRMELLLKEVL